MGIQSTKISLDKPVDSLQSTVQRTWNSHKVEIASGMSTTALAGGTVALQLLGGPAAVVLALAVSTLASLGIFLKSVLTTSNNISQKETTKSFEVIKNPTETISEKLTNTLHAAKNYVIAHPYKTAAAALAILGTIGAGFGMYAYFNAAQEPDGICPWPDADQMSPARLGCPIPKLPAPPQQLLLDMPQRYHLGQSLVREEQISSADLPCAADEIAMSPAPEWTSPVPAGAFAINEESSAALPTVMSMAAQKNLDQAKILFESHKAQEEAHNLFFQTDNGTDFGIASSEYEEVLRKQMAPCPRVSLRDKLRYINGLSTLFTNGTAAELQELSRTNICGETIVE